MLLTAKTTTAMLAVCARAAFMVSFSGLNRSVILQVALDQLLGSSLGRLAEMELDAFDSTGETKREPPAIPGIDGRHRVLADVQALEPEASRHLLLDSPLPDDAPVVKQAHDCGSAWRLGRLALEVHAKGDSSSR